MGKITGISDGATILSAALEQALLKLNSDDVSILSRLKGIQGLTKLVVMDDKQVKASNHGRIGPKTLEVLREVRKAIMEAVADSAKEELKRKGQWKKEEE